MGHRLAPLISLALIALTVACSGGDGSPSEPPPAPETSRLLVSLVSGANVRGVSLDLRHSGSASITSIGPAQEAVLADASCQYNIERTRTRASCAATADFSAGALLWSIVMSHPAGSDPASLVTSQACTGTDAEGDAVPVSCSVLEAVSAP